jgi:hypothetical protein
VRDSGLSGLRFRGLRPLGLAVFLCLWGWLRLAAQDVQLLADRSYIEAGETFGLQLIVTGTRSTAAPTLPNIPGVRHRYLRASTQMESINGQTTIRVVHQYVVKPDTTNDVVIPPMSVRLGNQTFRTTTVRVVVLPAEEHQEVAWLKLIVPRTECVVGETIPVELQLYCQSVRDPEPPRFDLDGFLLGRSVAPTQAGTMRGNDSWSVVTWKFAATATRTGTLKVGPAEMNVTLVGERTAQRGNLLDEFFGGVREMKRVTLKSAGVAVQVTAPPRLGQPPAFAGAIGRFAMTGSVSPREVTVGDPVTLRLEVAGVGSIERLELGALPENREFRSYGGTNRFEAVDPLGMEGRKFFEYVLVPEQPGTLRVPLPPLVYFDPVRKEYGEAIPPALTLNVRASTNAQVQPTLQGGLSGGSGSPAVRDAGKPQWRPFQSGKPWCGAGWGGQAWVPVVAVGPWLGWGLLAAWRTVARHRRARPEPTPEQLWAAELSRLRQDLGQGKGDLSHAERAVRLRLGLWLGRNPEGITGENVARDLVPRRVSPELCQELEQFFTASDARRFGSPSPDASRVETDSVLALLKRLDEEAQR